ncbi:MAG: hypothetical protein JNL77_12675 [Nitrosomonas sp.]|nr:hypothetical protein [Nitrosomonas sp.]
MKILINRLPDLSDLVSYIRLAQVLLDKQKELLTKLPVKPWEGSRLYCYS